MEYLLFLAGIFIIVKVSDIFLDKAIYISRALKIPEVIVGATIVSFCTVLPETVISLTAVLNNDTAMGFGNAIGSVICNTAPILGAGIVISKPKIRNPAEPVKSSMFLLLLCLIVFWVIVKFGGVTRISGVFLLGITAFFVFDSVFNKKRVSMAVSDKSKLFESLIVLLISAVIIGFSSKLLVTNGEKIAENLGVPNMIIGLVLTAVGSSLPEFVTCITAIKKEAPEISFGNIIGANILNVGMIIGVSALIKPITVSVISSAFYVLTAICFVFYLLLCFMRKDKTLYRADGLFMIIAYIVFVSLSLIK